MRRLIALPLFALTAWLVACSQDQVATTGPDAPGVSSDIVAWPPGSATTASDNCGIYGSGTPLPTDPALAGNAQDGDLVSPCHNMPAKHPLTVKSVLLPSLVGSANPPVSEPNFLGLEGMLKVTAVPYAKKKEDGSYYTCEEAAAAQSMNTGQITKACYPFGDDADERGLGPIAVDLALDGSKYSASFKPAKYNGRGRFNDATVPSESYWQIVVQVDYDLDGFDDKDDVMSRIVFLTESPSSDTPNNAWSRDVSVGSNLPIAMVFQSTGCLGNATGSIEPGADNVQCLVDFEAGGLLTSTDTKAAFEIGSGNGDLGDGTRFRLVTGDLCSDVNRDFEGLDIPTVGPCVHWDINPAIPEDVELASTYFHWCEADQYPDDFLLHMQHHDASGNPVYTVGLVPVTSSDTQYDCGTLFSQASDSFWGKLASLVLPEKLVARHSSTSYAGTTRSSFQLALPQQIDTDDQNGGICPTTGSFGDFDCTDPAKPTITSSQNTTMQVTLSITGHEGDLGIGDPNFPSYAGTGSTVHYWPVPANDPGYVTDTDFDGLVTVPFEVGTSTSQLYVWGCAIATAGPNTPADYNFGGGTVPGRDIAGIWGEIDHLAQPPADPIAAVQCPNDPAQSVVFTGFANGAVPGTIDAFIPPLQGPIGPYQTGVAVNNYPLVLEAEVCATPVVDGVRSPGAGEWADDGCHAAATVNVKLNGNNSADATVRWYVDATHAYFSVEVPVGGNTPNKANIAFDFDQGDGSAAGAGTPNLDDDQIVMSNTDLDLPDFLGNTSTVDGYLEANCVDRSAETPCNTVDALSQDAVGAIGWDGATGTLFYEVSKLLDGTDTQDFRLSGSDPAGFGLQLGVGNVRNKGNVFPATGYFSFFPFTP